MNRRSWRTVVATSTAVVALAASGVQARQDRDFSGRWIFVPERSTGGPSPSSGGTAPALSREFTATQDETSLTIAWTVDGTSFTETYPLDGKERKRSGIEMMVTTRAFRENGAIVIIAVTTGELHRTEGRKELRLNPDGTLEVNASSWVKQKMTRWRSVYKRVARIP